MSKCSFPQVFSWLSTSPFEKAEGWSIPSSRAAIFRRHFLHSCLPSKAHHIADRRCWLKMTVRHRHGRTVKISNSRLLPCHVYNSRVWTSCNFVCRSWKKNEVKTVAVVLLEGDAGSQGGGARCVRPAAGLAVMLTGASAFNTEVSLWFQTFWVISSREKLDWQNNCTNIYTFQISILY